MTIFAGAAGLSQAQVAATRAAHIDRALWTDSEADLLIAIDALCATGRMSPPVLEAFQATWTKEQQLEIFAVCGTYHTISFVANSARLPNEDFGALFPR